MGIDTSCAFDTFKRKRQIGIASTFLDDDEVRRTRKTEIVRVKHRITSRRWTNRKNIENIPGERSERSEGFSGK